MAEPIKLRKLRTGQLTLLDQIYKYRFVTIDLLQTTLRTKRNSGLYQKVETLVKQNYIGKRYKPSYRYKRLKATYYLLPKGLRAIQSLPKHEAIDNKLIKASYKDKTVSDKFIRRILQFYTVILHLQELYPTLKFFTKREMASFSYFPRPLPDGLISLKANQTSKPKRYLIDCIYTDMPGYAIKGKLNRIIEFFEEGGWEPTKSKLPIVIFLCDKAKTEQRVRYLITNYLENFEVDNITVYTSTILAISNATLDNLTVWSDVTEPDELMALGEF